MGLNYIVLILLLCTAPYWQSTLYRKTVALWMLFIVLASIILQTMASSFIDIDYAQYTVMHSIVAYALPLVWLSIYIAIEQRYSGLEKWLLGILGIVLIVLGYFDLFLLLVMLSWAIVYQQSLIKALCILLLIFSLWMLYYNLGLSFLLKSLSIFISGILLLGIAWLLSARLMKTEGEPS